MSARLPRLVLALLLAASAAAGVREAEPEPVEEPTMTVTEALKVRASIVQRLYLYDHEKRDSAEVVGKVLPNRVYVKFSAQMDEWVFVKSDSDGKIPTPMEVLVVGTVLPGYFLGARKENEGERFRFEAGGKWVSTKEPELHRLVVLSKPPKLRTVEFFEEKKIPLELVSGEKIREERPFYPAPLR